MKRWFFQPPEPSKGTRGVHPLFTWYGILVYIYYWVGRELGSFTREQRDGAGGGAGYGKGTL
jgi:hypothetical protein